MSAAVRVDRDTLTTKGLQGDGFLLCEKEIKSIRSGFFAQMDVMHLLSIGNQVFPTLVTDPTQWPQPGAPGLDLVESLSALGRELGIALDPRSG